MYAVYVVGVVGWTQNKMEYWELEEYRLNCRVNEIYVRQSERLTICAADKVFAQAAVADAPGRPVAVVKLIIPSPNLQPLYSILFWVQSITPTTYTAAKAHIVA